MGAVIRAVGYLAEGGELAPAQLVEDLAGLGVAEGVVVGGLQLGQRFEGGGGQLGLEREGLVGGDAAVATEQGHEPGQPRSRQRVCEGGIGPEAQRRQVDQGLAVGVAERVEVGLQYGSSGQPLLQRQRHARPRPAEGAAAVLRGDEAALDDAGNVDAEA